MAGLRISGGTINLPSGLIKDTDISDSAAIDADKMQHVYKHGTNFALAIAGTPVAREEIVIAVSVAGTIRGFHALLNDTGTTTDVDFDLKKDGVSILSSVVNFTNADADRLVKDGTLSSTTVAPGDVISIELIVTTSTAAQGPYAWVEIEENDAP